MISKCFALASRGSGPAHSAALVRPRRSMLPPLACAYSSHATPKESAQGARKKVTLQGIRKLYESGKPITMMTAHDYPSGLICDRAGLDTVLVGDSLAMVALGHDSTNRIALDEMIHHAQAVARGCKAPFIIGDLPFGTYERNPEQALDSAIRFVREGNVEAVKLEGGKEMTPTINKLVSVGIPVLGHIGLTPQRSVSLSGFKVQGKTADSAKRLLEDALTVQEAGCFAMVLEAVPAYVAQEITKRLSIPTIGIGAGPFCSGQVLVFQDIMGVFDAFQPKFCKQYASLGPAMTKALEAYREDVRSRTFPDLQQHCYDMDETERQKFEDWLSLESPPPPPPPASQTPPPRRK
ncbi:ketopantoate hydroxymethyltransferase-domain-containing protein [Polychytrium aggregatum]|uniref:ketopantoate hydroxymethyltransferase-domain-containing protein n=1 Tax=Polychytrium aggregatum TaxID=110093 RepID=UPI0022FECC2C|nr:ketopantoate hydroxymethyltransferase-domain-containing protein [Polychytrium aggregatum]KAI9204207.1 ketopantoate hydroxymethyltransferase-domain-containing protein [Polychytrium aggregatum]